MGFPLNTRKAPSLGSAARLTSGTRRSLPARTPRRLCHGGRGNRMLLPPRPLAQPRSACTCPFDLSVKVVPPTPTTHGSDDSYSACRGPVGLCPVLFGFA